MSSWPASAISRTLNVPTPLTRRSASSWTPSLQTTGDCAMTMQVSNTIGASDKVVLDAPIFDPVAFRLSDEQAGIITRAREIGQSVFAGRAATYDREAIFPTENYRDLHRVGLL